MAEEKKEEKRAVSKVELQVAYDGPAYAANRFFVTVGPQGVRIAFTEESPDVDGRFRTAVQLSVQDAIGLKNLLAHMLKGIEPQIEAAEAEAKTAISTKAKT